MSQRVVKKHMQITLKGAHIAGIYTIVAAILGVLLTIFINSANTASQITVSNTAQNNKAVKIVQDYFNIQIEKTNIDNLNWFDFSGNGTNKEFYIKYYYNGKQYYDIFTLQGNIAENIFHRVIEYCSESSDFIPLTIQGKSFLIFSTTAGSGNYLDLEIYQYDGIGKAKCVHSEYGFYEGELLTKNNKILISGNCQKYELKYDGNEFKLVKYNERLQPEEGSHVLTVNVTNDDVKVLYDNEPLEFPDKVKNGGDRDFCTDITLKMGELIYVDEFNTDDSSGPRIFLPNNDIVKLDAGFYTTIEPLKPGKTEIEILNDEDVGVCYEIVNINVIG